MTESAHYYERVYGSITVFYTRQLDGGGGSRWGQDIIPLIRDRIGPVNRVFEWCAGPGFIGFSLLAEGLCNSVTLADINPRAVEIARHTISHNKLDGTATVLLSDCFDSVPRGERWDLVVGNPPHVATDQTVPQIPTAENLYQDPDWRTHRKFYEQVGGFLNDNGSILLVENGDFSSPAAFRPMVDAAPRLSWVEAIPGRRQFYFVWVRRIANSPD